MASSNLLTPQGIIRSQFLPPSSGVQNPMTSNLDADNFGINDLAQLSFAGDVVINTVPSAPSQQTDGLVYDPATNKVYTQTLPVVPSGLVENPMTVALDAGNQDITNVATFSFNGAIQIGTATPGVDVIIPIPQVPSGNLANAVSFDFGSNKLYYQPVLNPIYDFNTVTAPLTITLPTSPASGITTVVGGTFTVSQTGVYGLQFNMAINVDATNGCVASYGDLVEATVTAPSPLQSNPYTFLIPPIPNTSASPPGADTPLSGSVYAVLDSTSTYTFELVIHNASGTLSFPPNSGIGVSVVRLC